MNYEHELARNYEECQILANKLLTHCQINKCTYIGMDTETTVTRTENTNIVSLIQFAVGNKAYLFQTYKVWQENRFPSILKKILTSISIIKVGVAIQNDIERIRNSFDIKCLGFVDIQSLTTCLKIPFSSLNDLGEKYIKNFTKKLAKDHNGDWDGELDTRQIKYASLDAIYSLMIFNGVMNIEQCITIKDNQDQEENEKSELYEWLKQEIRKSKSRTLKSLVNQISNSYGPWRNKYIEIDRQWLAMKYIKKMIEEGMFEYDQAKKSIINNDTTGLKTDIKDIIDGIKYESAIAYLCNSDSEISRSKNKEQLAKNKLDAWVSGGIFTIAAGRLNLRR